MKRRVFGIETEYGIVGPKQAGGRRESTDDAAYRLVKTLTRPDPTEASVGSEWLPNGAKFYQDLDHPEYATPECDSVRQTVAADRAGQLLVIEALAAMGDGTVVTRNNSDRPSIGERHSFGCHENYLVARYNPAGQPNVKLLEAALTPFFVTRQLLCGAGDLIRTFDGVRFTMSQRAPFFEQASALSTLSVRGIFNTKDESHATSSQYRLHVIVGDTNMSEWSTFLKLGSTHLVLRMIEDGETFDDLRLVAPVCAIKATSRDLTGRVQLSQWGRNSPTMSPLDIQEQYLLRAEQRFAGEGGETAQILAMWRWVVGAYQAAGPDGQPPSVEVIAERLGTTVDWAIKYRLIEAYRRRHGYDLSDTHVDALNLKYHTLDAEAGLFAALERRGAVARITTDAEITELARKAPSTTRASLRGRVVCATRRQRGRLTAEWEWVIFCGKTYWMDDPLDCHQPDLERQLARMEHSWLHQLFGSHARSL